MKPETNYWHAMGEAMVGVYTFFAIIIGTIVFSLLEVIYLALWIPIAIILLAVAAFYPIGYTLSFGHYYRFFMGLGTPLEWYIGCHKSITSLFRRLYGQKHKYALIGYTAPNQRVTYNIRDTIKANSEEDAIRRFKNKNNDIEFVRVSCDVFAE